MNPGLPERMEVESPTLKERAKIKIINFYFYPYFIKKIKKKFFDFFNNELDSLTKKLDLLDYKMNGTETPISEELYGFKMPTKIKSLTFINVKIFTTID